ncbi:MAG: hypothetical protein AB2A00_30090 [Myxococcota bacterium]
MPMIRCASVLLLLATLACPRSQPEGTGPMGIHGAPEPSLPLDVTQYPWPTDLARKDGRVSVLLPDFGEDRDVDTKPFHERLAAALAERHGFSGTAAVMFTFDKPLAVSSLPASAEASAQGTAAFILGISGPHKGQRIPARVAYRADERRLFLSPDYGQRLLGGEKYAGVVTTKITGEDGQPVRASEGTRALLGVCPRDELPFLFTGCAPAHAMVQDLLAELETLQVAPAEVAVATVFTIEKAEVELQALRNAVYAEPSPTLVRTDVFPKQGYDLDRLFGVPSFTGLGVKDGAVPHASVAQVIHGTFRAPLFNSAVAGFNGVMEFDANGAPVVKGYEDILFTLVLPNTVTDVSALPLLVYQHGLGGQRSEVLVIAEEFCRRGYAVAGIDLPFHGSRTPPLPARDAKNNITGDNQPDGIGDSAGLDHALRSLGITSDTPGLQPMAPTIVRDSLRQGHADVFGFVRAILDGEKAPLVDGLTGFAGLGFDPARVYWASESYGSIHGVPIVAMEPRITGAVFSVGGGGLVVDLLMNSPQYGPPFGLFLYQNLALRDSLNPDLTVNYEAFPPEREWKLQLYQNAIDVADPAAFAPLLARFPGGHPARNVLFIAPFSDEAVPNQAEESMAMQAGAHALRHADRPELRYGRMPVVDAPLRGNVNGATVAYVQFHPATHGVLTRRQEDSEVDVGFPPFVDRPSTMVIQNPVDQAQQTAADFLDGLGAGNNAVRVTAP